MIAIDKNGGGAEPASPQNETDPEGIRAKSDEAPRPRVRGFAAMDRELVKAIARKGGLAAHAAGTAHEFSSDEARTAGRKGGTAPHARRGGARRPANPAESSPAPSPSEQSRNDS